MPPMPPLPLTTAQPGRVRAGPLRLEGLPEPLTVRVSARTKRLALRVNPADGRVEVVVPPGCAEAQVQQFVARHLDWVRQRLAKLPPHLPFQAGAVVPVLGEDHIIRHIPEMKGAGQRADGALSVGGDPAFLERRVRDLLRREALQQVTWRTEDKAARLGEPVRRITVRDTRSRWGSCGSNGRVSYSWRLILAPEPVLDYVVAHEVAHLREMNHSPSFWRLVATLTDAPDAAKAWLKANGAHLLRYG